MAGSAKWIRQLDADEVAHKKKIFLFCHFERAVQRSFDFAQDKLSEKSPGCFSRVLHR